MYSPTVPNCEWVSHWSPSPGHVTTSASAARHVIGETGAFVEFFRAQRPSSGKMTTALLPLMSKEADANPPPNIGTSPFGLMFGFLLFCGYAIVALSVAEVSPVRRDASES